jgi:hypothetical protein
MPCFVFATALLAIAATSINAGPGVIMAAQPPKDQDNGPGEASKSLRICRGLTPTVDRPRSFKTEADSQTSLAVWTRFKK